MFQRQGRLVGRIDEGLWQRREPLEGCLPLSQSRVMDGELIERPGAPLTVTANPAGRAIRQRSALGGFGVLHVACSMLSTSPQRS